MTSLTSHGGNNNKLTSQELLEKRRSTLIQRTRAARQQLDSLSLLDSSYDVCRQTLRQWRTDMLDQINSAHATSLTELNTAYDQLVRFRSTIASLLQEQDENDDDTLESNQLAHIESSLNTLRNAEFTFDFDRATQLDGELKLIKMTESRPQTLSSFRLLDESLTQCRLLVSHDRYVSEVFFQDEFVTKIDCQTPECILVCPFDLLDELLGNDEEVRLLIDQTYLPSIGLQATRMRVDYDLALLQPAPECCPQSSERVIRIKCTDRNKLLQCLREIYTICSQQPPPAAFNPYTPINYNRAKVHSYYGYLETVVPSHSSPKKDPNKINPLLPLPLSNVHSTSVPSLLSTTSSSNHFDRVLMPVSIRQSLPITDMQAGALLGPKGERIQQLQRETGAIVNIGDLNDESSERRRRIVYVQGSQQQVNNALQAIRRLITIGGSDDDGEDSSKRDGGGKSKKT